MQYVCQISKFQLDNLVDEPSLREGLVIPPCSGAREIFSRDQSSPLVVVNDRSPAMVSHLALVVVKVRSTALVSYLRPVGVKERSPTMVSHLLLVVTKDGSPAMVSHLPMYW